MGSIVKRTDYGATLELIAEGGADAFYTGAIADSIVETVRRGGVIMTRNDLQGSALAPTVSHCSLTVLFT